MLGDNPTHQGTVAVSLDLNHAPGVLWARQISKEDALYASPSIGPDGTIYQVDAAGDLVALNPADGSVKWTSAAVLGVNNGSAPTADTGSSPAVAADGTIYVGSENGGIYQFSATDGSNKKIFSSGKYQGSSITMGPDGTLYAGSVQGYLYAINRDGSNHWSSGSGYHVTQCPSGTSPFIQSTAALDSQGNVYFGVGCTAGGNGEFVGGVISLNPDGSLRWASFNTKLGGKADDDEGATYGPVVLSQDGSQVFVVDSGGRMLALAASSGHLNWFFQSSGQLQAPPALSPDGSALYLEVSQAAANLDPTNPNADDGLAALTANGGNVVNALHKAQNPSLDTTFGTVPPLVDTAGNVLMVTANNMIAYSGGLGSSLFGQYAIVTAPDGNARHFSGVAVGSDGTLYLGDSDGEVVALSPKLNVPAPTATPTSNVPTATPWATNVASPTPDATISQFTKTPTPAAGTPTNTPTASATRDLRVTSLLPTAPTRGLTTTAVPGAATPTAVVSVVRQHGYSLSYVPGSLNLDHYSRVIVQTVKGATISYTVSITYLHQAEKKGALSASEQRLGAPPAGCPVAMTIGKASTYKFNRTASKTGKDEFCIRVAGLPSNVSGVMIALTVRVTAGKTIYAAGKPIQYVIPRVMPVHLALAATRIASNAKELVTTTTDPGARLVYRVTFVTPKRVSAEFTKSANAKGRDTLSFKPGVTPSQAVGMLSGSIAVQGTNGALKGSSAIAFQVIRPGAVIVLGRLSLKPASPTIKAGGVLSVQVVAARGAKLSWTVQFGAKNSATYASTADGSGYATLHLVDSVRPAKGKRLVATLTVVARQGRLTARASTRFTVEG